MRAIDLYSGIGGWSFGLACAGIQVAEAYEIWPAAVQTYNRNLGTHHKVTNVRELKLSDLPQDISLVVGSPPCTQFSFANRGGGGNISEGLKDVVKFFEIVRHVRPTYWIMENVPRTAAMIRQGLETPGHPLFEFHSLAPDIKILDLAMFGLPQSRSRCFVGVFPFDRLESLSATQPRRLLGEVIDALSADTVRDPLWKIILPRHALTEMEPEPPLNQEQLRMNREAKRFHPVYNDMSFPDALDRPSRTVTATCTRVSRESIVVAANDVQSVRRLTVRERATLQGFPLTYQFYGISHSQKVKMIGNAVPPYFAFLIGLAAQDRTDVEGSIPQSLTLPDELPDVTPPHAVGTTYPAHRRFRAALPGLRFKSGMRFQLANGHVHEHVEWSVGFFFGPSKSVRSLRLDQQLYERLKGEPIVDTAMQRYRAQLDPLRQVVTCRTRSAVQASWRQSADGVGPYQLVDLLGHAAIALSSAFATAEAQEVVALVLASCLDDHGTVASKEKLTRNAPGILAGLVLGSWFNTLQWACDIVETGEQEPAFSVG